jgi:hypothetical protein
MGWRVSVVGVETKVEWERRSREPGKSPGVSRVPVPPGHRMEDRMEGMRSPHCQKIKVRICLEFCGGRRSECDLGSIRQTNVAGFSVVDVQDSGLEEVVWTFSGIRLLGSSQSEVSCFASWRETSRMLPDARAVLSGFRAQARVFQPEA